MSITIEMGLRIAPTGVSTSRCYHCNVYLSAQEQIYLYDRVGIEHACGQTLTDTLDTWTDLEEDSVPLLQECAVRAATWYHFTSCQDWDLDLGDDLLVHVGTRPAALARRRANDGYDRGGFLYSMRLRPGTLISSGVGTDMMDGWPRLVSECGTRTTRNYSRFIPGANRYLNHMEAPGSISLLVPAVDLIIESRQIINPEAAPIGW